MVLLKLLFALFGVGWEDYFLPEPTAEQKALVEKLGDRDFHVRHQATQDLIALGRTAVRAAREGLTSDCPERATRAEQVLSAFNSVQVNGYVYGVCEPFGLGRIPPQKLPSGRQLTAELAWLLDLECYLHYCTTCKGKTSLWDVYGDEGDAIWRAKSAFHLTLVGLKKLGWSQADLEELVHAAHKADSPPDESLVDYYDLGAALYIWLGLPVPWIDR